MSDAPNFDAPEHVRMLRDQVRRFVATQHMMAADATFELTGRLFPGLDTDAAML